jgi:hypothetical protein
MADKTIPRRPRILKVDAPSRDHPKEYAAWRAMKSRCYNPKDASYKRYGGRGIRVCDRWLESFDNFYADIGPAPSPDSSFGREDNDGMYEPENCRWETTSQQNRNRSISFLVDLPDGRQVTLGDLARERGEPNVQLFVTFIWDRIHRSKYTLEEALSDMTDGRRNKERKKQRCMLMRIRGGPPITWQEASAQRGLKFTTAHMRFKRGASIAESLGLRDSEVEIVQTGIYFGRKR